MVRRAVRHGFRARVSPSTTGECGARTFAKVVRRRDRRVPGSGFRPHTCGASQVGACNGGVAQGSMHVPLVRPHSGVLSGGDRYRAARQRQLFDRAD